MLTASSASGDTCATVSSWNFNISKALEVVEGFPARAASIVSLAGRGPELADAFGCAACTARTGHDRRAPQLLRTRYGLFRRRDPEGAELAARRRRQPVARPRRRQHFLEHRLGVAVGVQSAAHAAADHFRGRT